MANAGCINAIGFDGCFLRTLQCLDSSNIGVGVQYTAPNPLDDKRLDYIKYTDKCGCVQCLSAENEILIYATNGVIKNLTLTNDDVNEAIKIKWNDIFGSNRVKTVVRYKTGSYPVSITDGTLAVEETTKNQYSSTPFSLSGVLDETTYYISAFAVDGNGTIINVQSNVITTDFIFSGYKRVEYIQSSGNEYIDTNYIPQSNTRFYIRASTQGVAEHTGLFGSRSSTASGQFLGYIENTYSGSSNVIRVDVNNVTGDTGYRWTTNTPFTIDINAVNRTVSVNGNIVSKYNNFTASFSNVSIGLFTMHGGMNGTIVYAFPIAGRIYECKIYQAGNLIRDFYPVYRKQDNVVGLFDSVNKVFYTNISGVGSFTKGPDIN